MSEPLSDEEIRKLRRLQKEVDEDVHHIDNGAENSRDAAAGEALTRLLDEVEGFRRIVRHSGVIKNVGYKGETVLLVGVPSTVKPIKG